MRFNLTNKSVKMSVFDLFTMVSGQTINIDSLYGLRPEKNTIHIPGMWVPFLRYRFDISTLFPIFKIGTRGFHPRTCPPMIQIMFLVIIWFNRYYQAIT